ncbi:MAG: serine/threonine protein kinase [Deltaproteobacteria bacterium]|nr:serine/threonine protein kinase [Deltaproteobacteria bacterium]
MLARGGMGEVALGLRESGSFRRLVAIKRLRSELRADETFRTMFLEEAKIAGLIRHPNVVPVLDVGVDQGGPYLVMDYVEGVTLGRVIRHARQHDQLPPVQVAVRIMRSVALGLAATHGVRDEMGRELGLIHRDVSPQNVMLSFDGTVRLTDFGIAKAVDSTKTATGLLKGKTGYMSPEQLRFERPTQRSDLFSLGVVLYELLTCERLYRAEDVIATAQQILNEPAPDLFTARDDAPPELVELCFELLAKDPMQRCGSAREVAERLGEIIDELAAREGGLRIEDFMVSEFAAERESSRARVQDMVREWEDSRVHGSVSSPPVRPGKRWRSWAAVAAVALGTSGAIAFGWERDDSPARVSSPPPEVVSPVPVVETEPESPAVSPTETAPVAEPAAPTPMHSPARMRRARRSRPSAGGTFDALDVIRESR